MSRYFVAIGTTLEPHGPCISKQLQVVRSAACHLGEITGASGLFAFFRIALANETVATPLSGHTFDDEWHTATQGTPMSKQKQKQHPS